MSLTTEGRAPGPVRFRLACDRGDCAEHTTFDLVIAEPPPDRETDFLGHLLHEAHQAMPYIDGLGWVCAGGAGYRCPTCAAASRRRPADTA
ncbi:hypothetical protein ACSNOK_22015 [Streptomyces sp. URMC 126]|uniref:hypothetical protein n=1 Tax=Streptomyces sp. URMC 126 TaxID=3423401 RepID=UPI003F1D2866